MSFNVHNYSLESRISRTVQNNFYNSNNTISQVATGKKIINIADDPFNTILSNKLNLRIRSQNELGKTLQTGQSMIDTASAALTEYNDLLLRMKNLTIQAANGILTDTDRNYLQNEINSILANIDDIVNNTNYAGKRLLDPVEKYAHLEVENPDYNSGIVSIDIDKLSKSRVSNEIEVSTTYNSAYVSNRPIYNNGKLFFEANLENDGEFKLWSINLDGTGLTEANSNPGQTNGDISPDGQFYAYNSPDTDTTGLLYYSTIEGSETAVGSIQTKANTNVSFHPTNSELVSYIDTNGRARRINIKTTDSVGITGETNLKHASWGTNGIYLTKDNGDLFFIADGGPAATPPAILNNVHNVEVSPNNNRIAGVDTSDSGDVQLFYADHDGTNKVNIGTVANVDSSTKVSWLNNNTLIFTGTENKLHRVNLDETGEEIIAVNLPHTASLNGGPEVEINNGGTTTLTDNDGVIIHVRWDNPIAAVDPDTFDITGEDAVFSEENSFHLSATAEIGQKLGFTESLLPMDVTRRALNIEDGAVDVTTAENAISSLTIVENAINNLSKKRAQLGAASNKINFLLENNDVYSHNLKKTLSVKEDTDYAEALKDLVKHQILSAVSVQALGMGRIREGTLETLLTILDDEDKTIK